MVPVAPEGQADKVRSGPVPARTAETFAHDAERRARFDTVPADPFGAMTERERAFLQAHGWTFHQELAVPADGGRPAVITHQIHVPPGGSIPLHDHRDLFGAVVCAAGEVEIRSFDISEGGNDTATVMLQERTRAWLVPGRFSLLTRAHDNVHEFRAGPAGARILDVFAWLRPEARSHELEWLDDPAGKGSGERRFRARWRT